MATSQGNHLVRGRSGGGFGGLGTLAIPSRIAGQEPTSGLLSQIDSDGQSCGQKNACGGNVGRHESSYDVHISINIRFL